MTFPKLSWLNGKTFVQSGDSRKNRPGRKPEHADAIYEYQFVKEEKHDKRENQTIDQAKSGIVETRTGRPE